MTETAAAKAISGVSFGAGAGAISFEDGNGWGNGWAGVNHSDGSGGGYGLDSSWGAGEGMGTAAPAVAVSDPVVWGGGYLDVPAR